MNSVPLPDAGFLSNASDDLKHMLGALATEVHLKAGEALFEQGDEGDAFFALVSGALEVSVLAQDGRRLALDVMRPGALFGEIAMFDPGERTATVTALEASMVRRVVNTDLMQAVRRTPELAIDMIHLAGLRMRWMNKQLNEQVFLPVPTRLARKILHLTPQGADPEAILALSQSELADFVGATREAVSKTLAVWKRIGVVEATRGGLRVLDETALRALAEPDLI